MSADGHASSPSGENNVASASATRVRNFIEQNDDTSLRRKMSSEKMASLRQLAKGKTLRPSNLSRTTSVDESKFQSQIQDSPTTTQQNPQPLSPLHHEQPGSPPPPAKTTTDSNSAAISSPTRRESDFSDPISPTSASGSAHARVAFSIGDTPPQPQSQPQSQQQQPPTPSTDPIPLRKSSTHSIGSPPSDSGGSAEDHDRSTSLTKAPPSVLLEQEARKNSKQEQPAVLQAESTTVSESSPSSAPSNQQQQTREEEQAHTSPRQQEPPDEVKECVNPLFKGNAKIFSDLTIGFYFDDIEMELTYFNKHKRLRSSSDRVQQLRSEGHKQPNSANSSPPISRSGSTSPPSTMRSYRAGSDASTESGENDAEMGESASSSPVLEGSFNEQAIFPNADGSADREAGILSSRERGLSDGKAETQQERKPRVVYSTDNFPSRWTSSIALLKMQNTDTRSTNVYRNEDPWKTLTVSWRILRNM